MKKVLSFVLVLAMILGCATTAFAVQSYPDQLQITNTEAVGVLSMLGVFEGDENGNMRPTATLTRAEACKIIACLMLGTKEAKKLTAPVAPFKDVAADNWAAGYIAFCASEGIVAGVGNNNFNPTGTLKVGEFGKMLLCALGYDAAAEGLTGSDWANNTAKLMVSAGITVAQTNNDDCAREVAAQLAFNALKADTVYYESNGGSISVGGTKIDFGKGAAKKNTVAAGGVDYDGTPNANDSTLQLCEKLYGAKLALTSVNDDFGRLANKWTYDNNEVIAQAAPKFVYTAKKTAKQIAADLKGYKVSGSAIVDATTTFAAVDANSVGVYKNSNSKTANAFSEEAFCATVAGFTGNGKLVEIYVDSATKNITSIHQIVYSVAEVTSKVKGSTGNVTYGIGSVGSFIDYADDTVYADTIILGGEIEKGDIVTYVERGSKLYVYPTTQFTGAQTSITTKSSGVTILVGGKTYTLGEVANATTFSNGEAANYYVDKYGYVVYTDAIANNNYAYVVNVVTKAAATLDGANYTAQVRVVLEDGAIADYDVYAKKSGAAFYVMGIDGKNTTTLITDAGIFKGDILAYTVVDGKICFKNAEDTTDFNVVGRYGVSAITDLEQKKASYTAADGENHLLANSATKFVVYNTTKNTTAVYTGIANVPSTISPAAANAIYKVSNASYGALTTVFVEKAATLTADKTNYAYVDAKAETVTIENGSTKYYYTAYDKSGAEITVSSTISRSSGMFEINDANQITGEKTTNLAAVSGKSLVRNGLISADQGAHWYNITDSTVTVYLLDTLTSADDNVVTVVYGTGATANDALVIYVTAD